MIYNLGVGENIWSNKLSRYIIGDEKIIVKEYFQIVKNNSIEEKEKLPYTVCGIFKNNDGIMIRNSTIEGNFQGINVLPIDLDDTPENWRIMLSSIPYKNFYIQSPSSSDKKIKIRLYIFLHEQVNNKENYSINYKENVRLILDKTNLLEYVDWSCKDVTRAMFIPNKSKLDTMVASLKKPTYSFIIFKTSKPSVFIKSNLSLTAEEKLKRIWVKYADAYGQKGEGERHAAILTLSNRAGFMEIDESFVVQILNQKMREWGFSSSRITKELTTIRNGYNKKIGNQKSNEIKQKVLRETEIKNLNDLSKKLESLR